MPQPKENSPIKRDILFRVHLLYAAFVLIAALVFARLIWVQLFSSEVAYNAERLEGRIFTDEIIPARRGNILTRDGEPLATSLFRYQVEMDYGSPGFDSLRTFREQSDSLAKLLALYFRDKSAAAYAQAMQREHARRYRVTYRKDTLVPRSEGGLARWWDRMRGEEFLTVKLYDTLRARNRLHRVADLAPLSHSQLEYGHDLPPARTRRTGLSAGRTGAPHDRTGR